MKKQLFNYCLPAVLFFFIACHNKMSLPVAAQPVVHKKITLDGNSRFQTIDGFGVNITPAQWHNGNLKTVIDSLTDDLGATLFRFDCYGLANWLDPQKQTPDGSYPQAYLASVYTGKTFKDAWAAFRYLNSKGIEPILNVSGAVPHAWTAAVTTAYGARHDLLVNYDAYATMVVSMVKWAREKEGLKFRYFMPFNETDLGFPEGPRLRDQDLAPAVTAVINKLKEQGLGDVQCIVPDDANAQPGRIGTMIGGLKDTAAIAGFGVHTYGNGYDEDGRAGYFNGISQFALCRKIIDSSRFQHKSLWLTEYGDLDQSNEIEFEVGWRSTRRLLKCLNDGMNGAMAWDAFDNFHEHDTTWAQYGLFKTDTVNWRYTPKPRYYAARQVYKFVRPGFRLMELIPPASNEHYVYKEWTRSLRNMLFSAFVSPDGKNFTLTGMSNVEMDVDLEIELRNLPLMPGTTTVRYYRTSAAEKCREINTYKITNNTLTVRIPHHSIFTITTL